MNTKILALGLLSLFLGTSGCMNTGKQEPRLQSALTRIGGNEAKVENTQVEVPQRYKDYLSLHFMIGARQEVPSEALQRLINQDSLTSRYGQPVYIMQVRTTESDMGGEFRIELLNHATFEEIEDGRRKFIECTWVVGRDSEGAASDYLTCWYELYENRLALVASHKWETGWEF